MRQPLPNDGARYPCCFEFTLHGGWRCPKDATEALDQATVDGLTLPSTVVLWGRALCETHLTLVEGYASV